MQQTQALDLTVAEYGEDRVFHEFQRLCEIHNQTVEQFIHQFCVITDRVSFRYGGNILNLPLVKNSLMLDWTRSGFYTKTVGLFLRDVRALFQSDTVSIQNDLVKRLFSPFNSRVRDYTVKGLDIDLYALLNGDDMKVELDGYRNIKIPGNHNHFTYSNGMSLKILKKVAANVAEHDLIGDLHLYVGPSLRASVYSLVREGFSPFVTQGLGFGEQNDEMGVFDVDGVRCIVYCRNWVPRNYLVALDTGMDSAKALGYREIATMRGLRINYDHDHYPLRSSDARRYGGFGILGRHMAACHFVGDEKTTSYEIKPEWIPKGH